MTTRTEAHWPDDNDLPARLARAVDAVIGLLLTERYPPMRARLAAGLTELLQAHQRPRGRHP